MSDWAARWADLGRRSSGAMTLREVEQEARALVVQEHLSRQKGRNLTAAAEVLGACRQVVRAAATRALPEVAGVTEFVANGALMGYLDTTADGQQVDPESWGFGFTVDRDGATLPDVPMLMEADRLRVTVEVLS